MSTCDKCGQPAAKENDAAVLEAIMLGSPLARLMLESRHLLPVVNDDGTVLCEGSPSRAQYLPEQPRDNRGYEWDEGLKGWINSAYAQMTSP